MPYIGNPAVVGDSTNTFKLLDDIQSFTLTFDATDTSVVSISDDTLTFRNHRFLTGQRVTYNDGGGTAIGGLADGVYFIIKVDQNTIKLASSASNAASSTAINLTSGAAGGSHTLNVAFDSVNTKFSATHSSGTKAAVSRAGQISLSINGVIQQPQDTGSPTVGYGVLPGSIIIFSTAPAATDKVFGTFIGEVAPSFDLTDNTVDNFTGDGSTTTFNLSRDVPSSNDVLVTLDGVTQYPTDSSATRSYAVIESTLTFVSAPDTGVAIQVRHIGFAGATTSAVTGFYGRQGNVALVNTDDISVQNISAGIATFNTIAVGGTVSIGGTLTYEDVTNIDSVGLVTARNGIVVGSGITLSKDGDGFFTGIVTATTFSGSLAASNLTGALPAISGANLTNLDASDLASGTVPTARLGSGTASSSTFLRGDSTFQTVNTDLVSDTSPQLGGNLDVNSKAINFGDSNGSTTNLVQFGAGTDLRIYHEDGVGNVINSYSSNAFKIFTNGNTEILTNNSETCAKFVKNGAVELYHDNVKKLTTYSAGVEIHGSEGANCELYLYADEGDDDADNWKLTTLAASSTFQLQNRASGSWETNIEANGNGNVELYYDNSKKLETTTNGAEITGRLDVTGGYISLDDNYSYAMGANNKAQLYHSGSHQYLLNTTGNIYIQPKSGETGLQIVPDGAVWLYYDNEVNCKTSGNGIDLRDQQNSPTLGFFGADGTDEVARITGDAVSGTTGQLIFSVLISDTTTHVANFDTSGHFLPYTDNTYNLGSSSKRWANIYTGDLQLSNEGKSNDVDGTWGDYTIQEGESDLFLINNRSGKKYKFNLTEVS